MDSDRSPAQPGHARDGAGVLTTDQVDEHEGRHIAVAGGGFTGMVCALRLLKAGYRVTVFEAQDELGGLATAFDFGPFRWDKFYHCILKSDAALLSLLDELGLGEEVRWTKTKVGLFAHGKLHTMTGAADLLRYPHLSLLNKARLALGTAYVSKRRDGWQLERQALDTWTKNIFGKTLFREFWEPLFRCKLGEMRHKASAAFLWGTLRRLASTRDAGPGKAEQLGYVKGGYARVFDCLSKEVSRLGATVLTSTKIHTVSGVGTGVEVTSDQGIQRFDGALMTLPNHMIQQCLDTDDTSYLKRLGEVQYLGLVCQVLLLRRSLSPYYLTNITEDSPFTGVVEMTNLIDAEVETAGLQLVYLPRYTSSDDPLLSYGSDQIWELFGPALRSMHPGLVDGDIVGRFAFTQRFVQPVPTLNYSDVLPPISTPVANVFLVNTSQIENNTLNNNVMTMLAEQACGQVMQALPMARQAVMA